MSERARTCHLEEEIAQARIKMVAFGVVAVMCLFPFALDFFGFGYRWGGALFWAFFFSVGVALLVAGLVGIGHYSNRKSVLLNKLRNIGADK